MARRPTSKDYAGRQVDIELLRHVEEPLPVQPVQPDIHTSTRIVSGIEKTVQRYAKLFLTHIGTCRLAPDLGGTIVRDVGTGRIQGPSDLSHLYAIANSHALTAMKDDDDAVDTYGGLPDDEAVDHTELKDISVDRKKGRVRIHVLLVTKAGSGYTFVIPVGARP